VNIAEIEAVAHVLMFLPWISTWFYDIMFDLILSNGADSGIKSYIMHMKLSSEIGIFLLFIYTACSYVVI
jgi:hypothetical protein